MNIAVKVDAADAAKGDAYALPLDKINPGKVERFQDDTLWPYFERLRSEDPVNFTPESEFGPYWSITRWDDILAVDTNHEAFTSTEGIGLGSLAQQEEMEKVMGGRSAEMQREAAKRGDGSFIGLDEPHHGPKRKAVSPTLAPANIINMSPLVRERAGQILDSLPIGEPFDWVDKVSMELTAMTLATLFLAQAVGADLTFGQYATIILIAMLTSKGASGVTGAGFITLAATLAAIPNNPVPVAAMTLVLGIDKFMSECRALTNLVGNGVATIVVSAWENELDRAKLKAALAHPIAAGDAVETKVFDQAI